MTNFCEKLIFPANEPETPEARVGRLHERNREEVSAGVGGGDVVARDDVIECKSLRYTVIEHFSHFPSRASVTSCSLARSLVHSFVHAAVLSRVGQK